MADIYHSVKQRFIPYDRLAYGLFPIRQEADYPPASVPAGKFYGNCNDFAVAIEQELDRLGYTDHKRIYVSIRRINHLKIRWRQYEFDSLRDRVRIWRD